MPPRSGLKSIFQLFRCKVFCCNMQKTLRIENGRTPTVFNNRRQSMNDEGQNNLFWLLQMSRRSSEANSVRKRQFSAGIIYDNRIPGLYQVRLCAFGVFVFKCKDKNPASGFAPPAGLFLYGKIRPKATASAPSRRRPPRMCKNRL